MDRGIHSAPPSTRSGFSRGTENSVSLTLKVLAWQSVNPGGIVAPLPSNLANPRGLRILLRQGGERQTSFKLTLLPILLHKALCKISSLFLCIVLPQSISIGHAMLLVSCFVWVRRAGRDSVESPNVRAPCGHKKEASTSKFPNVPMGPQAFGRVTGWEKRLGSTKKGRLF